MAKKYATTLEWIQAVKDEETQEAALADFYNRNWQWTTQKLRWKGIRGQDAEDVFQDAILVLTKNVLAGKFKGEVKAHTYFWGIVKNLLSNKQRRKSEDLQSSQEMMTYLISFETPESYMLREDEKERLREAMDRLEKKCQQVLEMYSLNYSMKEIADIMNWENPQSAMNASSECRKKLAKLLGHSWYYN